MARKNGERVTKQGNTVKGPVRGVSATSACERAFLRKKAFYSEPRRPSHTHRLDRVFSFAFSLLSSSFSKHSLSTARLFITLAIPMKLMDLRPASLMSSASSAVLPDQLQRVRREAGELMLKKVPVARVSRAARCVLQLDEDWSLSRTVRSCRRACSGDADAPAGLPGCSGAPRAAMSCFIVLVSFGADIVGWGELWCLIQVYTEGLMVKAKAKRTDLLWSPRTPPFSRSSRTPASLLHP